jgi:hypothetical protein
MAPRVIEIDSFFDLEYSHLVKDLLYVVNLSRCCLHSVPCSWEADIKLAESRRLKHVPYTID